MEIPPLFSYLRPLLWAVATLSFILFQLHTFFLACPFLNFLIALSFKLENGLGSRRRKKIDTHRALLVASQLSVGTNQFLPYLRRYRMFVWCTTFIFEPIHPKPRQDDRMSKQARWASFLPVEQNWTKQGMFFSLSSFPSLYRLTTWDLHWKPYRTHVRMYINYSPNQKGYFPVKVAP